MNEQHEEVLIRTNIQAGDQMMGSGGATSGAGGDTNPSRDQWLGSGG